MKKTDNAIKTKQVVNVHSAAVHIEHKVSLKARLSWFVMLYKAYPYLEQNNIFTIRLSELKKIVSDSETNNKRFKEMLKELVTCPVEWNIFNKEGDSVWGISTLLSSCEIVSGSGICSYSFSPHLQKKILNPSMYIKLNLLISKRFTSKNTLAIYCLALDYLQIKQNYGEKILTVNELRKFLGLEKYEYKLVGDLHRRIIKKAEEEINRDSDMQIEIKLIRGIKNKITAFKFCMSIKEKYLSFYLPQFQKALPEPPKITEAERLEKLYDNKFEIEINIKNEELRDFLSKHSISFSSQDIQNKLNSIKEKIGEEQFENYLFYLIDYTNRENSRGIIKTISGFFINLLKDDTQLQNYLYSIEKEEKNKRQVKQKINVLYEGKIKNCYDIEIYNNFKVYLKDNYEKYEPLFIQNVEENKNSFSVQNAINKNNGKIDSNLLENNTIMRLIFKRFEQFGYTPINYNIWKENFLKNEKNKECCERLNKEAIKEVNIK